MVSILIPTYEMAGRSVEMLHDLLNSLDDQTYKQYEVIISDDSDNEQISNDIEPTCCDNNKLTAFKNPSALIDGQRI